jgi:glutathione S-transferase
MTLRVCRIPFSTNVERVALAAGHKQLEIEWVDVDPADRSLVEQISGQSLVPVLVADGEIVFDSPVILEWVERRFPEPSLYPAEPAARAAAEVFVDWFNKVWKRPPNLMADELEKPRPDEALVTSLSHAMLKSVATFEALLHDRDYLFGEFGMADVVAFPFLKYAAFGLPHGDEELFHRILVEHLPLDESSPLRAWAVRVDAHPRS